MDKNISISGIEFLIKKYGEKTYILTPKKETNLNLSSLGESILRSKTENLNEVITTKGEITLLTRPDFDIKKLKKIKSRAKSKNKTSFVLPVCFGLGEDFNTFCKEKKTESYKVLIELTQSQFSLSMYGFLPGFLYTTGLPEKYHKQRKKRPRKNVPSGSVAIGGPYLGVYDLPSPGGWHIIGKTPLKTISFEIEKPIPIESSFKLQAISRAEYQELLTYELTIQSFNEHYS